MKQIQSLRVRFLTGAALIFCPIVPALAQQQNSAETPAVTAAEQPQGGSDSATADIVVTGSRIARNGSCSPELLCSFVCAALS